MLTFRSVIVHDFAHCCKTDFCCDLKKKWIRCKLYCFNQRNSFSSCCFKRYSWNAISVSGLWFIRKPLFQNNLTNLWGSCGNLFFFSVSLLVHLSCVTVYCSRCPAVHGGVWLGSRFLRALGRHPLWLPARLMSPCLVLGVILNYCGTEFPMSLRV